MVAEWITVNHRTERGSVTSDQRQMIYSKLLDRREKVKARVRQWSEEDAGTVLAILKKYEAVSDWESVS